MCNIKESLITVNHSFRNRIFFKRLFRLVNVPSIWIWIKKWYAVSEMCGFMWMVLSDRMPALTRNFFRNFIDLYMYVPSAPINVKCMLGHLRPRATPLFPNWKLAVSWINVRHDTVTTPVTFFFSSIRTVGSADKLAPAGPSSSSTKGR